MAGAGAQRVVADARGRRAACPGRVCEEGVQRARGLDVEVEVDAAVVGEDEVAEGVDALDGVGVGGVGGEEPGVLGGDEVEGGFVCPELVGALVIGDCDGAGREGNGREGRIGVLEGGHGPCTRIRDGVSCTLSGSPPTPEAGLHFCTSGG